jgi:hypothetical protein
MVATRPSNSIGLASNSSHSVAMAFSRSLSTACADRLMIGIWPDWASFLAAHYFPTVIDRHFEIHQDDVRALGRGQLVTLLTIIGRENLEIANAFKAHLEHVEVIVVVSEKETTCARRSAWKLADLVVLEGDSDCRHQQFAEDSRGLASGQGYVRSVEDAARSMGISVSVVEIRDFFAKWRHELASLHYLSAPPTKT